MRIQLALAVLFLSVSCMPARRIKTSVSISDLAGTYESCMMACKTVRMMADGRFTAVIDGDLFKNERAHGTWTIDDIGRVCLNTDQQPQIREATTNIEDGIRFKVLDQKGQMPHLVIAGIECQNARRTLTIAEGKLYPDGTDTAATSSMDSEGFVYVSKCHPTEFWIQLYSLNTIHHSPRNKASNEFIFVLDTTTDFYMTNELYLWKPGFLYPAIRDSAGGRWSDDPLKKLK